MMLYVYLLSIVQCIVFTVSLSKNQLAVLYVYKYGIIFDCSHLVCDPTIRQPGFNLPRQQWSLLNRFRTEQ